MSAAAGRAESILLHGLETVRDDLERLEEVAGGAAAEVQATITDVRVAICRLRNQLLLDAQYGERIREPRTPVAVWNSRRRAKP